MHVIYGSLRGLRSRGDQIWHQGKPGIPGTLGPDAFGDALGHGRNDR